MKKKICIRAEGGVKIGMGHVMRMLELANVLSKDLDVSFVSKYDASNPTEYAEGISAIKASGFPIIALSKSNFYKELFAINSDAILTDSYDVSKEYFDFVAEHFPVSAYMDDENIMQCPYFNVDIIINQNPYAHGMGYSMPNHAQKLLGVRYLILRDEFIGKPKKVIRPYINNVMVTVGGSDDCNVTETIVQQLLPFQFHLRVIIGGAFLHEDKLKKYCSDTVSLCYNTSMSDCMEWCDAAITSCGATSYEMAAMGVPALGIVVAENQKMGQEYMDSNGFLIRSTPESIGEDIFSLTQECRQRISDCGRRFVDGQGKYRIAEAIKEKMRIYR